MRCAWCQPVVLHGCSTLLPEVSVFNIVVPILQVRYVISLLRDILVALNVAQKVLGFVHYDLK